MIFFVIALTAAAGALGVPIYALPAGALVLTLLNLRERYYLRQGFTAIQKADIWETAAWLSAAHCFLAATAAYAWGKLVATVFYG